MGLFAPGGGLSNALMDWRSGGTGSGDSGHIPANSASSAGPLGPDAGLGAAAPKPAANYGAGFAHRGEPSLGRGAGGE